MVVGLLALNAAVIGFAVLVLLMARSPWAFPQLGPDLADARRDRLAGADAFLWWPDIARDYAPLLPTLGGVAFTVGAALVIHHYRATLRHSSQAARLLAAFLAMMLPSVVLYPSLVDAATRARRQLVESRYAPEVMNQRQDVRLKLQQALVEIDRIEGLDELVRASDPPPTGPPPTDAAFLVWSQTSLASQRMTSSVELHNASGAMVSRFAMKLPEEGPPQPWSESACDVGDPRRGVAALFRRTAAAACRARRSASMARKAGASRVRSSCTRCWITATCRSSRRRIRTSR